VILGVTLDMINHTHRQFPQDRIERSIHLSQASRYGNTFCVGFRTASYTRLLFFNIIQQSTIQWQCIGCMGMCYIKKIQEKAKNLFSLVVYCDIVNF